MAAGSAAASTHRGRGRGRGRSRRDGCQGGGQARRSCGTPAAVEPGKQPAAERPGRSAPRHPNQPPRPGPARVARPAWAQRAQHAQHGPSAPSAHPQRLPQLLQLGAAFPPGGAEVHAVRRPGVPLGHLLQYHGPYREQYHEQYQGQGLKEHLKRGPAARRYRLEEGSRAGRREGGAVLGAVRGGSRAASGGAAAEWECRGLRCMQDSFVPAASAQKRTPRPRPACPTPSRLQKSPALPRPAGPRPARPTHCATRGLA